MKVVILQIQNKTLVHLSKLMEDIVQNVLLQTFASKYLMNSEQLNKKQYFQRHC